MIYTDRTRVEAAEKCDRYGFWSHRYRGRGIVKARSVPPEWALLTGEHVHKGIERIFKTAFVPIENAQGNAIAIDMNKVREIAVKEAEEYQAHLDSLWPAVDDETVRNALIADGIEQVQLVKGLIYGWALVALPEYLDQFEPIEVEREEEISFTVGEDEITLLTRTDLLSRYKGPADAVVIHNFKTVSNADKKWRQQFRYDQQTLTEFIACENRIGKQITGVIIQGLLKGVRKEYPEDSGIWRHNNALIYCWYRSGEPPMTEPEYHARYAWTCKEPHRTAGKRAKDCPGGVNHRLSGVYKESVEAVYPGGIFAWIDFLSQNDPEILGRHFLTLEPISRSEWEVERWKRMVLPREINRSKAAASVNQAMWHPGADPQEAAALLDYHFPMITGHGNCLRPFECPMLGVCWGSDDPDDRDRFRFREPNHPKELEVLPAIGDLD